MMNGAGSSLSSLTALSPLDGRYASKTAALREYFSEYGLIKHRIQVELAWLHTMADCSGIPEVTPLDAAGKGVLQQLGGIGPSDAERVKAIEGVTNHDVKAIEYFIKERIDAAGVASLQGVKEFIHFSCTSEDINNLAYGLMLKGAVKNVIRPAMIKIIHTIANLAVECADVPLLSRTHGQPATPTTFGKELANVAYRLHTHVSRHIDRVEYMGKFNGAVGNFNAHLVAYPDIDWPQLAKTLVEGHLGLTYQPYSTQIECHDYIAELCDGVSRFNTTLMDFNMDMWSYIARDLLKLKVIANEVGSSTMPHKVNPIDFENSEGNLGVANALLRFFSSKLPISRLQRDLTDSTVLRNLGTALGNSLLAYESTLKGLSKVAVDEQAMAAELDRNWMILAEPVQTVMRKVGLENPYEKLKALTRGQTVDQGVMREFVRSLGLGKADEDRLMHLSPASYTGVASQLAKDLPTIVGKNA
ncbi:unnamed protein product [Vitrella brassicaformis CCMP3155]|uniref:Adenylosuccinate lyase n=1 Tax=Vitrella brassicaformis (strain CCMP3155) TaxID=1169540 RepID=A0A0G4G1H4_VITBC|nr:unnamed protein product [Vitrella brassicaformis CCMP3155]|eukprot:CEM21716.1 unnamed protein product [Vitrella brassicaformis CCMP3155]